METHGQGELATAQLGQGGLGQLGQGMGHADRTDGDLALGHAQIPTETVDGSKHRINVEQRLTHAHENHMAGAAVHGLAHAQQLINNFMGGQRALQPPFARGTETTGHGTAHLGGYANREAVITGNPHRFNRQAVSGL